MTVPEWFAPQVDEIVVLPLDIISRLCDAAPQLTTVREDARTDSLAWRPPHQEAAS